jgi:hypothetical protein
VEFSGLKEEIRSLPTRTLASLASLRGVAGAALAAPALDAAGPRRAPSVSGAPVEAAERSLLEGWDDEHAREAVTWLRSPAGERAREAVRAAARDATPARVASFMRDVRTRGLPVERRALVVRISKLTGAAMSADAVLAAEIDRALRGGSSLDRRAAARVLVRRPDLRARTARLAALWMLHFTYRDLSTAELVAAVLFLESPAGEWHRNTMHRALGAALAEALGADLASAARPWIALARIERRAPPTGVGRDRRPEPRPALFDRRPAGADRRSDPGGPRRPLEPRRPEPRSDPFDLRA